MKSDLITKKDLEKIMDFAKDKMLRNSLPMYVSEKAVEHKELVTLAIVQSTLMHLTSRKLLVNDVNIDFTDPSLDHDNELPLEERVKK